MLDPTDPYEPGTESMRTIPRTPTNREFALNEAQVFNEALARALTAALFWSDDAELRAAAEHAVVMAGRVARFLEIARAA